MSQRLIKRPPFVICLLLALWTHCGFVNGQHLGENLTELVSDRHEAIPLGDLSEHKIALVTPDKEKYKIFIDHVDRYTAFSLFDFNRYDERTKYYNTIIIAGTTQELKDDVAAMIRQSVVNKKQVILCLFDEQDSRITHLNEGLTLLKTPELSDLNQANMAMSIFGGVPITQGVHKREQTRIQYSHAELSHLDIASMATKIDDIAQEAIRGEAAPGLVVMALKNGRVIFEKAYGHHTYTGERNTKLDDIFDLASISKIAATTPVAMHLYEKGIINLDSTMGYYLWQAKSTNKANTTLRSVLLHEGGFTPYIPFYRSLKAGDVQNQASETHNVQLADNAYLVNGYYEDVMWPRMLNSPIKEPGEYVYSDISMYVIKEVAEHETSTPMDEYAPQILYNRIGMKTTGFNPRKRFPKEKIVPTEHDSTFRKVLLEGFVHDQGAAMAGGIAGHAGLFANANDLAIYGQMLLNRGTYGGVQYFEPETVDLFTSNQSTTSHRGLGFDRYNPKSSYGYPSKLSNESVYGHTGYTGTSMWVDPQNQLIYIFLSNRVHPQVSDKLSTLAIRARIFDVIYDTINETKK